VGANSSVAWPQRTKLYTTSTPMDRAVPLTWFITPSRSKLFRSGIRVSPGEADSKEVTRQKAQPIHTLGALLLGAGRRSTRLPMARSRTLREFVIMNKMRVRILVRPRVTRILIHILMAAQMAAVGVQSMSMAPTGSFS